MKMILLGLDGFPHENCTSKARVAAPSQMQYHQEIHPQSHGIHRAVFSLEALNDRPFPVSLSGLTSSLGTSSHSPT